MDGRRQAMLSSLIRHRTLGDAGTSASEIPRAQDDTDEVRPDEHARSGTVEGGAEGRLPTNAEAVSRPRNCQRMGSIPLRGD